MNIGSPKTRKDSLVDYLATQGQGLCVVVFYYLITWGFAYPTFIRVERSERPDFYPIFSICNTWTGFVIFCFLGLFSKRFRSVLLGKTRRSVSKNKISVSYLGFGSIFLNLLHRDCPSLPSTSQRRRMTLQRLTSYPVLKPLPPNGMTTKAKKMTEKMTDQILLMTTRNNEFTNHATITDNE